ncbi:MAG: Gfo/Idh/MocA family oxidoreductase [Leptospiraceae bacterium]|nr:Gfo/Idh/MocA family oxidoreductase [Leptospiraceae bacterium]
MVDKSKKEAERIHVALIGCGRIADLHIPGYRSNPHARLYALCDTDPDLLKRRQKQWKVPVTYTDYQAVLADEQIHAVEILTPQLMHADMVVQAARAGKHIAVQKPMTVDLKSADRMLAEVRKAGVIFKVTENYVFYPPIVEARRFIDSGVIGEPIGLRIKYIGGQGGWPVPASAWEWRMREKSAGRGPVAFDHGHHLWSTGWFLLGSPDKVHAWIDSIDGIVDCPGVVTWQVRDSRRMGSCEMMHAHDLKIQSDYYANDEWIEVTGSRGILFIRRCTGNIHSGPVIQIYSGHRKLEEVRVKSDWAGGFEGATHNFINAIRGIEPPRLSGAEGREILRFALAVARSVQIQRAVFVDELDHPFPAWYAWRRRRAERKRLGGRPGLLQRLLPDRTGKYAPQADALTRQLLERYNSQAAGDWRVSLALILTADSGVPEQRYTLRIDRKDIQLEEGQADSTAVLTLTCPAGVWAAILLKKKRIETAVLTGRLKADGKVEEGLKLRSAFGL